MTTPPVFAGVTLPRPNRHTRTPEPVVSGVTLANGATSEYHRGHRYTVAMQWRNLREVDALLVEAAARVRGASQLVDIDGTSYVARAVEFSGLDAVPGTSPIRYDASLSFTERGPR